MSPAEPLFFASSQTLFTARTTISTRRQSMSPFVTRSTPFWSPATQMHVAVAVTASIAAAMLHGSPSMPPNAAPTAAASRPTNAPDAMRTK